VTDIKSSYSPMDGGLINLIRNIMEFQPDMSLKKYLIIVFSTVIIVIVSAVALISLTKFNGIMADKARNYSIDISSQIKKGIDSTLTDLNRRVERVVGNYYVQNAFIQSNKISDTDKIKFSGIIQDNFDPLSIENLYISSIDVYFKDGTYIHNGPVNFFVKDVFKSNYYKAAMQWPTTLHWIGYNKQSDTIDAVRLIYDYGTYSIKGLLVLRIDKKYLFKTFMDYNMLEISNMYIVNENGQILASKDIESIGGNFDKAYGSLMNSRSGFLEYKDNFIVYQHLQDGVILKMNHANWKVIIVIERSLLYGDVYEIRNTILVYLLIFIILGIIISIFVSSNITTPIKKLVKAMKKVQAGDFEIQIQRSGSSETAFLIESFNSMISRIKTLISDVYEERLMRKDAELKALQQQINPHFMFNTLEMISWKAREYKAYDVYDMIQNLSYLLEANMGKTDDKMTTVKKELDYIRNYINLVKGKYQDKVTFLVEFDESILECKLPKLLLQPFVENAVNHGIANKIGAGRVEITGKRIGDSMYFEVWDDGIGMTADKLESIDKALESKYDYNGNTEDNFALKNAYRRIKLIYGEDYGYNIESGLYRGTKVTITVPAVA